MCDKELFASLTKLTMPNALPVELVKKGHADQLADLWDDTLLGHPDFNAPRQRTDSIDAIAWHRIWCLFEQFFLQESESLVATPNSRFCFAQTF